MIEIRTSADTLTGLAGLTSNRGMKRQAPNDMRACILC